MAAHFPAERNTLTDVIRVLLVDDHTMFRETLRLMLDQESSINVVGELDDGTQIQEAVARLGPDVVVMDVNMPNVNGIQATASLLNRFPKVRVVALSGYGHKQFVMEMLDAGATAYVVKSSAGKQLVHAITSAAQGNIYLCPGAATTLVEVSRRGVTGTAGEHDKKRRLGRRETEVLRLLAQGKSSPQIGESLHISPSTVDVHRRNIMNKLELRTVAELTKYAIRSGLTDM
jgi:two-component system NarL family response regulator